MTISRSLLVLAAALALPGLSACMIDENATLDERVLNIPGVENSGDRATQPGSAGANPPY